jgi:hypothetical protein
MRIADASLSNMRRLTSITIESRILVRFSRSSYISRIIRENSDAGAA